MDESKEAEVESQQMKVLLVGSNLALEYVITLIRDRTLKAQTRRLALLLDV